MTVIEDLCFQVSETQTHTHTHNTYAKWLCQAKIFLSSFLYPVILVLLNNKFPLNAILYWVNYDVLSFYDSRKIHVILLSSDLMCVPTSEIFYFIWKLKCLGVSSNHLHKQHKRKENRQLFLIGATIPFVRDFIFFS